MSNVQIRGGTAPVPSSTLVAVDNTTISGDGSGLRPLMVIGGGSPTVAIPSPGVGPAAQPGSPLMLNGTTHAFARAGINTMPFAQPLGLTAPLPAGGYGIQTGGVLDLPVADWDEINDDFATFGVPGLTAGVTYYASPTGGNITPGVHVPGESGSESTTSSPVGARIGYAISATEMLIVPGEPPSTIVLPNNGATVGMPVLIDEPAATLVFTPAEANASFTASRPSAIAAYIDAAGNVVGFTDGMVLDLPTATWDAIAGTSGGLLPDVLYYLSAATPGHITSVAPVATGSYQTAIGRAMTATKLFIQIGTPIGPHA